MTAVTETPPSQIETIHVVFPSRIAYVAVLAEQINTICRRLYPAASPREGERAERFCHDVHLAVHEAVVNIIEHAYQERPDQEIEVTFEIGGDELQITLRDHGTPFDPSQVPEPNLEEPQEGGLGLFLIRQLMDQVDYHSDAQGNTLRLVKRTG